VVSNRSIRRYRWRKPTPTGSQSWRTFLSNELKGIWAADLLVVHTINYRVLYVFFFISHESPSVGLFQRHRESDGSLDLAATARGDSLGAPTVPSHS
jgi:hypothetical protein